MSWTERRQELARKISGGLAGWLQLQAAQDLHLLPGEDSARFVLAQIVNAQGRYHVATSQRPRNWPENTRKRVDLALLGRSEGAEGWYGVIEAKWPGRSIDVAKTRRQMVQDIARLTTVDTQNLNARFFVLGGSAAVLTSLFDDEHRSAEKEEQRGIFCELLHRDPNDPEGEAARADVGGWFDDFEERIPEDCRKEGDGTILTTLVGIDEARLSDEEVGSVYVWQVGSRR
jgi:hypothetical protein